MRVIIILFFLSSSFITLAQDSNIQGIVLDSATREALPAVSILIFQSSNRVGGISNNEGKFSLNHRGELDSVKFSAIGYRSHVLKPEQWLNQKNITVTLVVEQTRMEAVTIHPFGVMDIVHKAMEKLKSSIPGNDFETTAFYREIIKDSLQYFSAAEAIFRVQFFPPEKSVKLMLLKGRTKEDVAYTRLFEDFHPGGGPEETVGLSLLKTQPDFLNENKSRYFNYKKEPSVEFEGRLIYVISFDQKPGIHESLESGKMFIDADDYSILKFEAGNSKAGTAYIKSLKGTDKIFAQLLNIDFSIRGWSRTAMYRSTGNKIYLDFASLEYFIDYKQSKKNIDLHLDIRTEWMTTGFQNAVKKPIDKKDEWNRKNLVANLPSDFDSSFWGKDNILSPTNENREMMEAITKRNNEPVKVDTLADWKYFNRDYFFVFKKEDSLGMVALKKCNWEDNETGGMIYKQVNGNFDFELKLSIRKRSDKSQDPDNGFQQAGIIVRNPEGKENNLIFSLGTGGNGNPKYFLKRTTDGNTKSLVAKTDGLTGSLKIERRGTHISAFRKSADGDNWSKLDEYELDWLKGDLQAGFSIMARFAGDGPKQHPDMRAAFSEIHFIPRD